MAVVVKFVKTIRNNWKKTVFFAGAAVYASKWAKRKYDDSLIREAYCLEAKKYGDEPLRLGENARRVTVFLNPAAQKGSGKKIFDKNVAPILHLAGLAVTVVRTEYEGQAKKYMDVLERTDAIVVAGGDGTVSEVVTGLLRREDAKEAAKIPVGVVPLGYTNTLARALFNPGDSDVKWMCEAALAVVKGSTRTIDVMGVTAENGKTVYAVNALEWGTFKEAQMRAKKYWYFGPLKHKWTYIKSTFVSWMPRVEAELSYVMPCDGCSKCYVPPPEPQWKWWHIFLAPRREVPERDYSDVVNDECGIRHQDNVSAIEFTASTSNCLHQKPSSLTVSIGPSEMSKTEFIKEGWRRYSDKSPPEGNTTLVVGEFTLQPKINEGEQFIIDNENFEVMPITVNLLKNKLKVFYNPVR